MNFVKLRELLAEHKPLLEKKRENPLTDSDLELIAEWEEDLRHILLEKSEEPIVAPYRWKLSTERKSLTHRFNIRADNPFKGYLTLGMYPSGRLGEMFLEIAKEGSFTSGIMDGLMTTISIGLQHGVPLGAYLRKFVHTRFEPSGFVNSAPEGAFKDGMKFAKSVLDYLAHYLDYRFENGVLHDELKNLVDKNGDLGNAHALSKADQS